MMMTRISDKDLAEVFVVIQEIHGDVAEIGVDLGETFGRIVRHATSVGKHSFAIDSFKGMDEPGEHDNAERYPKGHLGCSVDTFVGKMDNRWKLDRSTYTICEGFIPHCFDNIHPDQLFSFGLIDVDHYEPTVIALDWFWKHLTPGGIMILDDYFPQSRMMASRAIYEWLNKTTVWDYNVILLKDNQLYVEKM